MKRCPITYLPLSSNQKYASEGMRQLSPGLKTLHDFPYTQAAQVREAIVRAHKMSIQGVQPKLSVKFNPKNAIFEIVDQGGNYIIKPQQDYYPELPQNEDLTMRLAALAGIEVPFHGMIYCIDGSLSYFIKRFDRLPRGQKVPVEDFAQLSGNTRETKYRSSMEKVAGIIEQFCTFPLLEKVKFFRITLFCFLCGNEDMHLKNFSLIRRNNKIELSPAYDLANTTIALPQATEEMALPINGKKNKLTREDLVDYFGKERLGLNHKVVADELEHLKLCIPGWRALIDSSFLSRPLKIQYLQVLESRVARLFG